MAGLLNFNPMSMVPKMPSRGGSGGGESLLGPVVQPGVNGGGGPNPYGGSPYMPTFKPTGDVDFGDPGLNNIWGARPAYQGITSPNGQLYNGFSVDKIGSQLPWMGSVMTGHGNVVGQDGKAYNLPGMTNTAQGAQSDINSLNAIAYNKDGSMNTSFSPYAQTMMDQAGGNAMVGAQGNAKAGMDAIAQRGGLSGGAAERMSTAANLQGTNAYLNARQGIGAQDMAYKENLAGQLPGMQEGYAGFSNNVGANAMNALLGQNNWQAGANAGIQQFNTGNAINDVSAKNNQAMGTWGQMGSIWGQNQVSNAELAAANKPNPGLLGGGGILGTGIPMPFSGQGDNNGWHPGTWNSGLGSMNGWSPSTWGMGSAGGGMTM